MGDTLKWPKDTSALAKARAKQVQAMSMAQAKMTLRRQVADDIQAFLNKEFEAGKTREEMLTTLELLRYFAEQGPVLHAKVKSGDKGAVKTFAAQVNGKFAGGRGGNALMGSDEMFADNEDLLNSYLQRGFIDLVTRWSAIKPEVRILFVRDVLDSPKNYATTIDMTEEVLFGDEQTFIQRWSAPAELSMGDILEEWLDGESNSSIYTGIAAKGVRQRKRKQLEAYASETTNAEAYKNVWSLIVNKVMERKNLSPSNHGQIVAFFKQNIPDMTAAFRGLIAEASVRDFVENKLVGLLRAQFSV